MNGLRLDITVIVCLLLNLSHGFVSQRFASQHMHHHHVIANEVERTTRLLNSKWDNLIDEDDEEPYKISPDMKYIDRNLLRQNQHYIDLHEAGGPINDIYVRDPSNNVFWFCGKVSRISDITLEQCVARQWSLIEGHAAALRNRELSSKQGTLQIWTAPGDSELDVAYNRPTLVMKKMERDIMLPEGESVSKIRNTLVGYLAEIYDNGEQGFRTWRTEEGLAANPEASVEDLERVYESLGGKGQLE